MKHNLLFSTLLIAAACSVNTVEAQNKPVVKSITQGFRMPSNLSPGDYLPKTVVFRLKSDFREFLYSGPMETYGLDKFFESIGAAAPSKRFPNHKAPEKAYNERGEKLEDLSLIYSFNYTSDTPLEKVISKLMTYGAFEYAEPWYVPKTCYTPNDPAATVFEYHLTNIDAFNGWNISKGDTNVVIGITDTGVEPTHSDLAGNLKFNYSDPINGSDDDGDGFTDNFRGWDLGENDNDPTYNANAHGVHVTGLAAAVTDNNNGMAGVGFKCKYLPVKIADASGALTMAYDGIVYAADHGCAVINCSWGGSGGGQFGQNIINYATINKNALVVAAAGNNGSLQDFYPASYTYVTSVAGTNSSDARWIGSNYGYSVDVCAPGDQIYSTWPTNTYTMSSGTSMASPIAAGVAAIIKSVFPSYTGLQVGEQLKVTCDNIYPVNSAAMTDKLGNGRVNMFKAITQTSSPSVVNVQRNISDNNDNAFIINDTLRVRGDFTNYLAAASNVTATLSTTSSFVSIIDATTTLGAIGTLSTVNNNVDPFLVKILPTAPQNTSILFKITIADAASGYSAIQFFSVTVNVDYVNIAINDVGTTMTSKGRIGYNQDQQVEGLGFTYMGGNTLLYEASFMIGTSGNTVSDMSRGTGSIPDNDFMAVVNAHRIVPDVVSEFDVEAVFNDNNALTPNNVLILQNGYAWSIPGHRKYVIMNYKIKNTGSTTLNNLHAGIFADWDIMNYNLNKAAYDGANRMGYCWSTEQAGLYAGIKLLTQTPVLHYAIDNVSGGAGGVNLFDGYDGNEKFTTLSTNRTNAGGTGTGNDVCDVVSSGPFSLAPNDSVTVAFALIAGDSLLDIQNSAINAQLMYDSVPVLVTIGKGLEPEVMLGQNYPNPSSNSTIIETSLMQNTMVELAIFDMMGQRVRLLHNGSLQAGRHQFIVDLSSYASGVYYYRLATEKGSATRKMIVTK
jgi:subtilisin family serine protease